MSAERRVIVGETQQAGMPISAPVYDPARPEHVASYVRWVVLNNSFSLEFLSADGTWVEVPVTRI